jgi:hypothetical protein
MHNAAINNLVHDLYSVVTLNSSPDAAAALTPPPPPAPACLYSVQDDGHHNDAQRGRADRANAFNDEETIKRSHNTALYTMKLLVGHTFQLKNWVAVFDIMKAYCTSSGAKRLGEAIKELRVLAAKDFSRFARKSAQLAIDLYHGTGETITKQACFDLFMRYYGAVYARDLRQVNDGVLDLIAKLKFFSGNERITLPRVNVERFGCALKKLVRYIQGKLYEKGNTTITIAADYAQSGKRSRDDGDLVTSLVQNTPQPRVVSLKQSSEHRSYRDRAPSLP